MAENLRFELRPSDALAAHFTQPAATQPAPQPQAAPTSADTTTPPPLQPVTTAPQPPAAPPRGNELFDQTRERAERTLRVVIGSFIVPVLLALLVCYVTFLQLNEARARQEAMMSNLLTLQARLLEEDRARLMLAAPGSVPVPTPAP